MAAPWRFGARAVGGASAFVYDISGVPAVDGVTSTTDPAACKADLVINSNVLEHVGFPRRLVGEILAGNSPWRHGLPGSPLRVTARPDQNLQAAGTTRDHGSRTARSRRAGCRTAGLYTMHEHINYFTEQSLATLMRSSGCGVIASGTYPATFPNKRKQTTLPGAGVL